MLIENQLERTDHGHLGQLLTYAAGLDAVTIVWIAERFTEEHRAALDWLNEVTSQKVNLFGLEIELWRIGSSAVAPKFNVVCKPNEWTKPGGGGAGGTQELTESKALQLDFWRAFKMYVEESKGNRLITTTKPFPHHWMNISIGRSGCQLAAVASLWDSAAKSYEGNELRAEFITQGVNSKTYFAALQAQKDEIEAAVGESLTWHNPEGTAMCRAYLRRPASLAQREEWPNYHAWLVEKLEALHRAFASRVKAL